MRRSTDPPEWGRCPPSYFANGYSGIGGFLAATKECDVRYFEPTRTDLSDSGIVPCTQKERREGKRGLLWWLMQSVGNQPIDYFEFGVMSCKTFHRVLEWTANHEARFYGFDTFEGLPGPWIRDVGNGVKMGRDRGELKSAYPPAVYDRRAVLFKGLFQDSLPEALERAFPNGRRADRVNIDSDLYSSALYALTSIHPLLRAGDYLYFDEFLDVLNEFAAFNDYIRSYNTKSWFIPVARAYDGVLFRVNPLALDPAAIEVVDRRSTQFLDRMKAYLRARISLRKSRDPGR